VTCIVASLSIPFIVSVIKKVRVGNVCLRFHLSSVFMLLSLFLTFRGLVLSFLQYNSVHSVLRKMHGFGVPAWVAGKGTDGYGYG